MVEAMDAAGQFNDDDDEDDDGEDDDDHELPDDFDEVVFLNIF